jgi:hypothetical protein
MEVKGLGQIDKLLPAQKLRVVLAIAIALLKGLLYLGVVGDILLVEFRA